MAFYLQEEIFYLRFNILSLASFICKLWCRSFKALRNFQTESIVQFRSETLGVVKSSSSSVKERLNTWAYDSWRQLFPRSTRSQLQRLLFLWDTNINYYVITYLWSLECKNINCKLMNDGIPWSKAFKWLVVGFDNYYISCSTKLSNVVKLS